MKGDQVKEQGRIRKTIDHVSGASGPLFHRLLCKHGPIKGKGHFAIMVAKSVSLICLSTLMLPTPFHACGWMCSSSETIAYTSAFQTPSIQLNLVRQTLTRLPQTVFFLCPLTLGVWRTWCLLRHCRDSQKQGAYLPVSRGICFVPQSVSH